MHYKVQKMNKKPKRYLDVGAGRNRNRLYITTIEMKIYAYKIDKAPDVAVNNDEL